MSRVIDYIIGILSIVILPASAYVLVMGVVLWLDIILKILTKEYSFEKWKYDLKYMVLCLLMVITFFHVDAVILNEFIKNFISVEMFSTKLTVSVLLLPNVRSINKNVHKLTGHNFLESLKDLFKFYKKTKKELEEDEN